MRWLLVLLALGLATAQYYRDVHPEDFVEGFVPGNEYVFRYDSHVMTGVPVTSTQYSGVKILCNVRCQLDTNRKLILLLEDIKLLMCNDVLPNKLPTEPLPESVCTPMPDEQAAIFHQNLVRPIAATYEEGYIRDVSVPEDEPHFTINIKKGILNLFQVNMGQRSHMQDMSLWHPDYSEDYIRHRTYRDTPDMAFRVMEPDTCGLCQSVYTILPNIPSVSAPSDIMVTKVRNYLLCDKKPIWESGMLAGVGYSLRIPDDSLEKSLVVPYTHTDYILSGNPNTNNYVIKKALTNSKFIFTPYSEEAGSITAYIIQEMELKNVIPNPTPITPPTSMRHCPNGLIMELPNPITNPGPTPGPTPPPPPRESWRSGDRISQVETLLNEVISKTQDEVDIEAPTTLMKLIEALRECSTDTLTTIVDKFITSSTPMYDKKMEILLNTLPVLPTPEVVPVVYKVITEKLADCCPYRAGWMLNMLVTVVDPAPSVLNNMLTMCKDTKIRNVPHIWQATMLGLGAVTHRLVKLTERMNIPNRIIIPAITSVEESLDNMLSENSRPSTEEKITVLKTIGNTGLPRFINTIENVLRTERKSIVVRQAIYALRRIAPIAKRPTQSLLLPLYMDPRRPYEERIAAFVVLMDSQPSFPVLQTITHSLKMETNLHVGSFVYSYLRTLATTTNPILWRLGQNVRICLMSAKPISPNMMYSKAYHLDGFSERKAAGMGVDLLMIMSKLGVPESIVAKLNATIHGHLVNLVELGVETEGIETLLHKLVGPYGILDKILKKQVPIWDALKPHVQAQWGGDVGDEMKRILRKMAIKERPFEEFRGSVYYKMFGHELKFATFDKDWLMGWKRFNVNKYTDLLTGGPKNIDFLQTYPLGESSMTMPTPIGIPIALNISMNPIIRLKGTWEVTGVPSIRDILRDGLGALSDNMGLKTNLEWSGACETTGSLSVVTPVFKMGTAVRSRIKTKLPLNLDINYDTTTPKVKIILRPPTQEVELLYHELMPMTFSCLVHPTPTPELWTLEAKEISNKTFLPQNSTTTTVLSPLAGRRYTWELQYPLSLPFWAPYKPLTGKIEFRLTDAPTSTAAKKVTFEITLTPTTPPSYRVHSEHHKERSWWSWSSDSSEEDSREILSTTDFLPVTVDPTLGPNPTRRVLQMIVTSDTSRVRKSKAELLYTPDYYNSQINVQVFGDVFFKYDTTEENTYNLMSELVVNGRACFASDSNVPPNTEAIKYTYMSGYTAFEENKIILRTETMTTPEEGRQLFKIDDSIPIYSYTTDIDFDVQDKFIYRAIASALYRITGNLYDWIDDVHFTKLPISKPPPNRLVMRTHVVPLLQKAMLLFKTPCDIDEIVVIPLTTTFIEPLTLSTETPMYIPTLHLLTEKGPKHIFPTTAKCEMAPANLRTCDEYSYRLPTDVPPECETVLTQDCTSHQTFSILTTLHSRPELRRIKLLVPKLRVEIVPVGDGQQSKKVLINGREKPIYSGQTVTIRETENDESSPIVMKITEETENRVKIWVKEIDLTIKCDPVNINVEVPRILSDKICGLCGNFNGDKSDELQGPDMRPVKNPWELVTKYTERTRECRLPDIPSSHEQRDSRCQSKLVTAVEPRTHDGRRDTCFSIEPVKVCTEPCEAYIRTKPVAFHCMEADADSTRRLKRKARDTVLWDEMRNKPVDWNKDVEVCEP